jgi:hypothetical protein
MLAVTKKLADNAGVAVTDDGKHIIEKT